MPLQNIGTNSDGSPIQGLPLNEHPEIIQILQNLTSISTILQTVQQDLVNHNHDSQYSPLGSGGSGGTSQMAIIREVKPKGIHADHLAPSTWQTRKLNALNSSIPGLTLTDGVISIPAGNYWCQWAATATPTRHTAWNLHSPSLNKWLGRQQYTDFTDFSQMHNDWYFHHATMLQFTTTTQVQLLFSYAWAFSGYEALAAGLARNLADEEQYCWVKLIKL